MTGATERGAAPAAPVRRPPAGDLLAVCERGEECLGECMGDTAAGDFCDADARSTCLRIGARPGALHFQANLCDSCHARLVELVEDLAQRLHAVETIRAMLDGREWRVEDLDEIAGVLRGVGYVIRDPSEAES